jgi:hypothetical protein
VAIPLPLLFTWDGLEEQQRGEQEMEFRVVMQQGGSETRINYINAI